MKLIPNLTQRQKESFYQKVDFSENIHICWDWKAAINNDGYGFINYYDKVDNKYVGNVYKAHRIAYYLHYKVDPSEFNVCHKCDNPKCTNPYHLFLGTQKDNMNDRKGKNRGARQYGSLSGMSKLTESDILSIRKEYIEKNAYQKDLASKYDVHQTLISAIITRKIWNHI